MIRTRFAYALVPACVVLCSGVARAQVHYDLGLSAGIGYHVETDQQDGTAAGADANPVIDPGPIVTLQGHVAVLPMLRAGLYLQYEDSPREFQPTRNFFGGGVSLRLLPPIWRTRCTFWWIGLGLGYEELYSAGFSTTAAGPSSTTVPYTFGGTTGGELEIPISIGVARRIRKPFAVFAEVGMRLGIASFGDYYSGRPGTASGVGGDTALSALAPGNDTFSFSLAVGIMIDK